MKELCRLRRLLAVCLAVLILAACVGCDAEYTYPNATERFFVNDFADILSEADEQAIFEIGVALQTATDAQVVLVTVDSLDGQELEEYSLGIARAWGIGDEEKNNGILLLFTTDGPHSRVEVGYGLEGALPDSKAGRILDTYLVPWYEDEDAWSARLTDTYKALINEVYAEYGLTEQLVPLEEPVYEDDGSWIAMMVVLVVVLVLITGKRRGIFFLPYFGGFHGGYHHHGGGFGGGFGGGGFGGGGGGFGGGGASR
ncbi:MAG: TPM domain-containing protein [Clostridia bacterium]|nr:TPM domain-containing protein [Clostridia bacterium]